MGDILSYIDEFGGFTFVEKPFCEVDGLILSHLSYYVYDNIVSGLEENKPAVAFRDMERLMDEKNFISVKWELEKNKQLFAKIVEKRRYRNTKAAFYVCEMNRDETIQFSAITFLLGNGDVFLSFRGTDDAMIGWKEDLYMAYHAGGGTGAECSICQSGGETLSQKEESSFYLWRAFQRRKSGCICCNEL